MGQLSPDVCPQALNCSQGAPGPSLSLGIQECILSVLFPFACGLNQAAQPHHCGQNQDLGAGTQVRLTVWKAYLQTMR